jgi:hypothetical protein
VADELADARSAAAVAKVRTVLLCGCQLWSHLPCVLPNVLRLIIGWHDMHSLPGLLVVKGLRSAPGIPVSSSPCNQPTPVLLALRRRRS